MQSYLHGSPNPSNTISSYGLGAESLRPVYLAICAAVLAYLCWRMVTPFLPAVCWAIALAIVAEPLRALLHRRFIPPSITALIIIAVVHWRGLGPVKWGFSETTRAGPPACGDTARVLHRSDCAPTPWGVKQPCVWCWLFSINFGVYYIFRIMRILDSHLRRTAGKKHKH
jgi:hypothetical protein